MPKQDTVEATVSSHQLHVNEMLLGMEKRIEHELNSCIQPKDQCAIIQVAHGSCTMKEVLTHLLCRTVIMAMRMLSQH